MVYVKCENVCVIILKDIINSQNHISIFIYKYVMIF